MAQSWNGWCWQLGLVSFLAMGGAIAFSKDCTLAQPTPDGTLGAERSVVTPNVDINGLPSDRIDGGAIRGKNLFHSFQQFNVGEGQRVYFFNPAGIENILTRVTGGSRSDILGKLGVLGNANLFLINPNGIIFGPNASLDIRGGSFVASTASSLKFADGTQFSATAPQTTPLLTVSVPIGLQLGGTAGGIRVQGSGLAVQPGKTLALVGGDITLEGGELAASKGTNLAAPVGRIELGSVAGVGEVSLNQRGNGWGLGYDRVDAFRDIKLEGRASVDASGEGGGNIQLQGAQLEMTQGSRIYADTSGTGAGGEVLVHTTKAITLSDGSRITADVSPTGTGTGGNLTIETGQLSIRDDRSLIRAATFPQGGKGGNLTVTASESVELVGGSELSTRTLGAGAAGDLTINTRRLSVRDGAVVTAGTLGQGKGGNLAVTASESVELVGSDSGLYTQAEGAGAARDLTLATRQLSVRDGAVVSASTLGQGKGGELRVNATNSVNLSGVDPSGYSSGLFTSTSGGGQAGNITVDTSALQIADGAVVSARTTAAGNGGNITVNANTFDAVRGGQVLTTTRSSGLAGNIALNVNDRVTLSGSDPTFAERRDNLGKDVVNNEGAASGVFANTASDSTGNGGSISIDPIKLTITDGAGVAVNSQGIGNAGNLRIQAGSINLDRGAFLSAATESGEGGNMTLKAQDFLLMRHNSLISAEARSTGNGGNITINTPSIVAVPSENSDIIANAFKGRGGNINITASGVFGIQPRERQTPQSDITASSQLGINGTVQINTLGINPSFGLVNLPVEPVNVTELIAQGCPADVGPRASKFVVTGRGGLPPTPREALGSEPALADLGTPIHSQENHANAATSSNPTSSEPAPLVEAQGWVTNAKGEVVLTAEAPTVTPHIPWLTPTTCHAP